MLCRQNQNYQNEKINQLERWMDQLRKDFNAIIGSRRWQAGNAIIRPVEVMLFKGRNPGAVHHIQQIFSSYKCMEVNKDFVPQFQQYRNHNYNHSVSLDRLMRQLEKDVGALSESARWRTGNVLIRIAEILLMRGKPRLALNHMHEVLSEFHTKTDQGQNISPGLMQNWMCQLEADYQNILASKRWQVGNRLVRVLEIILMRKKNPLVTDHMHQIFDQFNKGQSEHHCHTSDKKIERALKKRKIDMLYENPSTLEKDESLRELHRENELLLVNLHQVQEELECYFFKYHELKKQQKDI